ncbi:MAG: hemolysin III family protein [Holophaga sp.]|jgi:hemolysin III
MPHKETSPNAAAEMANSITHGLGAALSVLALVLLVVAAAWRGTARDIVGGAVFGAALVVLYTMSTLYHALRNPRAKRVFHFLDHSAIYLLIAGTYTPFCLGTLRGGWGWSLFGVIWGLAVVGVLYKAFATGRFPILSTIVYLAMGWLVVVAALPLYRALPAGGLAWLLAGGGCYTLGVGFYAWRRLSFHHAIWHLFVLGGSLCHVVAVLAFVIPRGR